MDKEQLRMQMLSGIITEGEYKAKLEENTTKESLNENFVGMGMVGNIFERDKTDYEIAFEHYSKSGTVNEEMEEETMKEGVSKDDEKLYLAFIKAANFLKGGGSDGEAWEMMWDEYPYM
jgi:hypothetical protein